jgi:hypothetical protein
MDKNNIQNSSKIRSLEESLYNKDEEIIRVRSGHLRDNTQFIERDWSLNDSKKELKNDEDIDAYQNNNSGFLKKFFISSLLFFLIALGFGFYTFFVKSKITPEDNISLNIVGSTFIKAGDTLPLTLEIENKNDLDLEVVDIITEYSNSDEKDNDISNNVERNRLSVGNIKGQQKIYKEIPVTLFGREGDQKEIKFIMEYSLKNSSTIFQKQKVYKVTLSSSPITYKIIAPNTTVPNQLYNFSIEVKTNTQKPIDNVMLAVQYPKGFSFKESNEESLSNNSVFDLKTLKPDEIRRIDIMGSFSGLEGDEKSIRVLIGTYSSDNLNQIKTNLGTMVHSVVLQKPFLSTEMFVNGSGDDIVSIQSGDRIEGEIKWKNNSDNQILNGEIHLSFVGDILDKDGIEIQDGFYNSKENKIIWNKNTLSSLSRISSKSEGSLYFSIPTREIYNDGIDKNPKLELSVLVKGVEDSASQSPKTLESIEQMVIKVSGDIFVYMRPLYKTGQFINGGSYPPKVDQKTTYTVEFFIDNFVNNYYKGEVKIKLPPNVSYNDNFYPQAENVFVDKNTGEITWKIGDIKNNGKLSKTLSIQLEVVPTLTQKGTFPQLINSATFKAVDSFTNLQVFKDLKSITTEIRNIEGEDSNVKNGQVIE